MAKKEFTKEERWNIAEHLYGVLCGCDLLPEEEDAIEQAMEIVSPEWVEEFERREKEAADWFDKATPEDIAALDKEIEEKLGIKVSTVKAPEHKNKIIDIDKHRKK